MLPAFDAALKRRLLKKEFRGLSKQGRYKGRPFGYYLVLWTSLTLSWGGSSGATSYEYCYDDTDDGSCTGWTSTGTSRSVGISGLAADTPYYWQVQANDAEGTTYADGGATAFWSFTTMDPSILTESMFLPLLVRD